MLRSVSHGKRACPVAFGNPTTRAARVITSAIPIPLPDIYFAASILRQGGGAVPGRAHLCRWHKRGWTYSQKPSLCDETSRAPKVDLSRACSTSLFSISSQEHQRSRFSLAILSQLHLRRLQRDVLEHLPARLLVHLGEKPTAPPWHGPRRVDRSGRRLWSMMLLRLSGGPAAYTAMARELVDISYSVAPSIPLGYWYETGRTAQHRYTSASCYSAKRRRGGPGAVRAFGG